MKISKRNRFICGIMVLMIGIIISLNLVQLESNSPAIAEIKVPYAVKHIFKRACYDCHSNETKLSWFDKLPVVSSVVTSHIKEGRKHLNFSKWGELSSADQKIKIWEIYNMINAGKMPLKPYSDFHPEARISQSDLFIIKTYVSSFRVSNKKDNGIVSEIRKPILASDVPVSVNGIKYMPEYRNWEVMSTTSRFDNGSMRVMFANPIAMSALRGGYINPWPKGSIIAKVVWEKLEDKDGNIRPGKLINIQYMVRDSHKYKETEGWGFARFDTSDLKPYGHLADFKKCIACHQAVKGTGFVFDLSTDKNL